MKNLKSPDTLEDIWGESKDDSGSKMNEIEKYLSELPEAEFRDYMKRIQEQRDRKPINWSEKRWAVYLVVGVEFKIQNSKGKIEN